MLHEMYTTVCVLTFLCHTSNCSEVYDRTNDNTVYISDYCPTFKSCPEGTHVLCSLHSPDRPNHEFCDNSYNVSFTPEMANLILTEINNIRSKIAKGLETGKDGVKLPRGYGIPRVQWDPELALFAQIEANRCTRRRRMCVATLKFDKPYTYSVATYFRAPSWTVYEQTKINEVKGLLTNDKLLYAVSNHYKNMYLRKKFTTPDVINNYEKTDISQESYLAIINSKMTHMGCGIVIYKTLFKSEGYRPRYLNYAFVICNFSSGPKNKIIYNTTDPKGNEEYTKNCGCRLPNKEDEDCLCNIEPLQHETKSCNEPQSINPQLIVLPIITVQNAPEDKLVANLKPYRKSIRRRPTIPENLIRNQFVPKVHRFEQVGYNKNDIVPRGDFVKVRKLTEIYTSNNKNHRYLSYKEPQVAYSNGDTGLLYSTRRDRFYNLTEKNGFNEQRKDIINEEFKFQILTLLNNLVKVVENARYKSDKRPLILKEIDKVFNMLVERNDRDKTNERIDQHSENLDYKSISRESILNAEKMSQRNTVREKADLENRYFIRNKTIDIYNRYDNANNDKNYGVLNNRRNVHNNNYNANKTIQSPVCSTSWLLSLSEGQE